MVCESALAAAGLPAHMAGPHIASSPPHLARPPVSQQLEEDQRVLQTEVLRSGDTGCNLPVNLKRLIENAQRKFGCKPHRRGPTGEAGGRARVLQRYKEAGCECTLFVLLLCISIPAIASRRAHVWSPPFCSSPPRPGPAGCGAPHPGAVRQAAGAARGRRVQGRVGCWTSSKPCLHGTCMLLFGPAGLLSEGVHATTHHPTPPLHCPPPCPQVVEGQDPLSREAQRNATLLFHTLLRSTLASKRVCSEFKLTRAAWHWLTGEVETRWVGCGVGWERLITASGCIKKMHRRPACHHDFQHAPCHPSDVLPPLQVHERDGRPRRGGGHCGRAVDWRAHHTGARCAVACCLPAFLCRPLPAMGSAPSSQRMMPSPAPHTCPPHLLASLPPGPDDA